MFIFLTGQFNPLKARLMIIYTCYRILLNREMLWSNHVLILVQIKYQVSTSIFRPGLNRAWGFARIWFQICTRMLRPSRCINMAELHVWALFSTLLNLQTAIGLYVYMWKNKRHTISRIFRTEYQKSFRSYVHAWKNWHTFRFVC